ncbi:MAG: hypothetical protein E8D49_07570 [Nitrospira sp.]|nr:MAG: hypothetical protein E8D49_07570 [Nitrospira sp.]
MQVVAMNYRQRKSLSSLLPAWTFLAIVFATGALLGCEAKPETPIYRIGVGPWIGFGPFYLAEEMGFFKEAGVKVQTIVLTGLAERNSALKSGQLDGLAAPVDYFVLSAGNHLEMTIVVAIDESVGGDGIVARPEIKNFGDLKGKQVAFQRGLPSEFFLRVMLSHNGMKFEDLDAVDMETAQAGASFIANKLDAAVLWEPWLSKSIERAKGNLLASTREHPNLIVDVLAFTNSTVSRSPQDVQAIVTGLLKAIEYWKLHPDQANAIMAPHFQIDPKKYSEILTGLKFCDLARNREYFGLNGTVGPIFHVAEQASSIWLTARTINSPVVPISIITTDFLKNTR